MSSKELIKKINKMQIEADNSLETYYKLMENIEKLSDELCENINFDDLRLMEKEDIVVGRRCFGKNSEGFYTLIIEEVTESDDLEFKSFISDGCRYGVFKHYVLKD